MLYQESRINFLDHALTLISYCPYEFYELEPDIRNAAEAVTLGVFKNFAGRLSLFPPGAEFFDLWATKLVQRFYIIFINFFRVQNMSEDFSHLILSQKMNGWIG